MEVYGATRTGRRSGPTRRLSLFTLEHANRTLPLVRRIVGDIVAKHKQICALEEECQIARPGTSEEELEEIRCRYGDALEDLRLLSEEISAIGCELKDVRRGIVDFRALHNGRVIEFCWRHGEREVCYWHQLDDGFHDRRPIDTEFFAAEEAVAVSPA
jgi:hypothetical protein